MAGDVRAERADISRSIEGRTLCSAFAATVDRLADSPALSWQATEGLRTVTWVAYRDAVRSCALGLRAAGLAPGEFVAILAGNRIEHAITDLATVHAGGVPVSVYTTSSPEQLAYVLGHCEATIAVIEDEPLLQRVLAVRPRLPRLRTIVVLTGERRPEVLSWEDLLAHGRDPARGATEFRTMASAVKPSDLATVVYTSGTTGPPKGVSLTHANVLWTLEAINRSVSLEPDDVVISYLPLAHALERWWSHWNSAVHGVRVSFCPDHKQLLTTLRTTRPTWFIGVPRVWEKLRDGIAAGVALEADPVRRGAAQQAIALGQQLMTHQAEGEVTKDLRRRWDATEPVRRAILTGVGLDRCRVSISGGAPLASEVVTFFNALGLPLAEGWGMTELTGTGTRMAPRGVRLGTVGVPLPGVEMCLAEDGELLVRGGSVMAGYYKDPVATAQILDEEGWLRTGDLAAFDEAGELRIIGRKKELIITAGGKNVSPSNLESLIAEHRLVSNVCVVGDGRPHLSALVALDPEAAAQWARARQVDASTPEVLAQHPDLVAEMTDAIDRVNARMSRAEQIRAFRIVPDAWTVATGELTPSLKMRRDVILARYADVIDSMYLSPKATTGTPPRTP